jgi:hypothetical protein
MQTAATATIDNWLATGHAMLAERDAALWRFADWIAEGRRTLGRDAGVEPVAKHLAITAHKLRTLAKIATAFPPEKRDLRVSFDVHAHLSSVPEDDRGSKLATAAAEGWGEREAKAIAVAHRQERAVFVDEDTETRLAVEIARAWNRAPPEARTYFMALAETAGAGLIDEDRVDG